MSTTTLTSTSTATNLHVGPPKWALVGPRRILLQPTRKSLLLLCPLLSTEPPKIPLTQLPPEVWTKILEFAMNDEDLCSSVEQATSPSMQMSRLRFIMVCKAFKTWATPIFYSSVSYTSARCLMLLRDTLVKADNSWDSLRRSPYSTPGRWITALDVSQLSTPALAIDIALTQIFAITPFLSALRLNSAQVLSKRAFASLRENCGNTLITLKGLGISTAEHFQASPDATVQNDPISLLIACTPHLEELELIGQEIEAVDFDEEDHPLSLVNIPVGSQGCLTLKHLHTLSMTATPRSAIGVTLSEAELPSLRSLTLTSYHVMATDTLIGVDGHGAPSQSITSTLIEKHGQSVEKLVLHSAPDWPPVPFTPPPTMVVSCPKLQSLTLVSSAAASSVAEGGPLPIIIEHPNSRHPLRQLILSRPNESFLGCIVETLRSPPDSERRPLAPQRVPLQGAMFKGCLPSLEEVRFSSVKYTRLTRVVRNTGANAGLYAWSMALKRYGIKVIDMTGTIV